MHYVLENRQMKRWTGTKVARSMVSSTQKIGSRAKENMPSAFALYRYLADQEMKLHLGAEDIGLYIQDQATRATQRIPVAARELARIREDAQSVRSAVISALSKLQEDASRGSAAEALAAIEELDRVKAQMEAACSTIKEAAGLSTLFELVDDLFAAGDIIRIDEALSGMRRGLAVVADTVPEFRNGRQRLAALEEKFASAVEGPLAAALAGQRGEEAGSLSRMMSSIGRGELVSKAYASARSPPFSALWDGYTPGTPFVSWLSTFYDQILHLVASECEWCETALPDQYPGLVLELLSSFFVAIDKPHRARLAGALTGAAGSLLPLEHMEQAVASASDFTEGLYKELSSARALQSFNSLSFVLQLVLSPVEGALAQYPDKEWQYLTAEISNLIANGKRMVIDIESIVAYTFDFILRMALMLFMCFVLVLLRMNDPKRNCVCFSLFPSYAAARDAESSDVALASSLGDSLDGASNAITAAISRCIRMTGGTALPALAKTMDRVLAQYTTAVKETIASNSRTGSSSSGPETIVPLLLFVNKLQQNFAQCNRMLEQAAAGAIPPLLTPRTATEIQQSSSSIDNDSDPHSLSLAQLRISSQAALRQQLDAFLAGSDSGSEGCLGMLPGTDAATVDLAAYVDALVEDVLCTKLYAYFAALPSLKEWEAQPASVVALPSFTPYPLQYVTAAGEYLMMLPQLLESSLTSEQGVDVEDESSGSGDSLNVTTGVVAVISPAQLVADWVDRAALAAARRYESQLQQLTSLSGQGAAQLAADIEYFCNVLNTLGLNAPPVLAAWQAALVASDVASLQAVAALVASGEGVSADARCAVELVAKLRKLEI